jgi:hypothetical protein
MGRREYANNPPASGVEGRISRFHPIEFRKTFDKVIGMAKEARREMADKAGAPGSGKGIGVFMKIFYALPLLMVAGLVGYIVWFHFSGARPAVHVMPATPFMREPIGDLRADLFTQSGGFRAMGNDVFIEFRDAQGKLVDVGTVEFDLTLAATNMVMRSTGHVFATGTPGQYRTTVVPQLAGEWRAKIGFEGGHGKAETNFVVNVSR